MDSTRTRSRDVEAALVDAAEAVLVREGPQALTVRAVATEAGVAPMGVYNRFRNKDGLVDAVLVRGFQGLRAAISGGDVLDPVRRLRICGERYRQFGLDHPQHYALMFDRIALEAPSEEFIAAASGAFGSLVENVAAAMASGVLRPDDPTEVAQVIWSAVHGATSLELKGLVKAGDPAAAYARVLDALLHGLAP